ncbi:MAG: hypothetical protein ABFD91_13885 [Anaerohalosphaeraceae bacterium]
MNIKNKKMILVVVLPLIIVFGPAIIQSVVLIEELGCRNTHIDIQTGAIRYQYYYCGIKFREKIKHHNFSAYVEKYHVPHREPDWRFINSNGILLTQFCSLGKDSDLTGIFFFASNFVKLMEQDNTSSEEITTFVKTVLNEIQNGNFKNAEDVFEYYLTIKKSMTVSNQEYK